ncbi:zinc-ribbon domain-containing protein [Enemella evansiae]|uniref:Zinc-ribbon domain-containing protein n=1 Tax=Enemella evansiae TaxID=2016499 RepID=A0A255GJP5_9ACTN|nr:zinc-ribbon domain-containing protein [Enemella evansiae]PFG67987.1 zinc ribbon family protein [Propionibacteriaceae bacterium ES.041]OYN95811.1 zinc-ribbon domain-containing protein [Enemella evansiae]OYO01586.1 zinc-ribbon domain-containing protein [Enemella evansiae]OYO04021.1 zinc-ribbon domain-containing protein [Enemella evansiae]OYO08331.1 zinc-ribbon domain-containing protein [Enemella evansiae]
MLILFGTKGFAEIVATLMYSCRRCGNQPLTLVKHGSKFTLFFIPLFTVSTRWSLVCNFCREEYQISAEEAQHHRQVAAS